MSINGLLNIGKQGIYANQTALAITGNNIANVSTEGYSRQRAVFEAQRVGGVSVLGVDRMSDNFLTTRLRETNSRLGARTATAQNLEQVELALGETDDTGLSKSIQDFFDAIQDLTLKPSGSAEREAVRSRAERMISSFEATADQLRTLRSQIDSQVVAQVNRINSLSQELATLNTQINSYATQTLDDASDPGRNTLLDQRDKLLNELSEYVPIKTTTDATGSMTVFVGRGVLVEGAQAYEMKAVVDESNSGMHEVGLIDVSGKIYPLSQDITEGTLGAALQARDTEVKQTLDDIERLVAQMVLDINEQHRLGTGLDGVSGRDFFTGLDVSATPQWSNKGGAVVTSTQVIDETALTLDDYEIRFTGAGSYDVVNTTSGSVLSSGNAYVSGNAIDIDGMRVVLTNSTGTPAAGDVFSVNSYSGVTESLDLSAAIQNDVQAIAAGASSAAGDNTNALALADLYNQDTMGSPASQTYSEYYDNIRLRVATAVENAQAGLEEEEITQQQIQSLIDGVSGVSLDEESTNIIQFQRAFQASSRVISATDELLQTIISMV